MCNCNDIEIMPCYAIDYYIWWYGFWYATNNTTDVPLSLYSTICSSTFTQHIFDMFNFWKDLFFPCFFSLPCNLNRTPLHKRLWHRRATSTSYSCRLARHSWSFHGTAKLQHETLVKLMETWGYEMVQSRVSFQDQISKLQCIYYIHHINESRHIMDLDSLPMGPSHDEKSLFLFGVE